MRGTLIAVTAFLFFFALTRLGMAEAITLSFIASLLIPQLAHLFLGEKMRGPMMLAVVLSASVKVATPPEEFLMSPTLRAIANSYG